MKKILITTVKKMMKNNMINFMAAVIFMMLLSACNEELQMGTEDSFTVTADATTKTYLTGSKHNWVTGDLLRILSEDGTCVKSSACQKAALSCDFVVSDWPQDEAPVYAVYCGQNKVQVEPVAKNGVLTARLEPIQKITHRESFAKAANLSAGILNRKSGSSYAVEMKNVNGLLKFSFSKYDDIKTVIIEDMDFKSLAGTVEFVFDDNGEPCISNIIEGESSLKISANGKTNTLGNSELMELPEGQNYYACLLPGTYRFKIHIVRANGEILQLIANSPVTVSRSVYMDLGAIDVKAVPFAGGIMDNESFSEDPDEGLPMHIDFSRVGYHWGEDNLPTLPVATTLTAPEDGSDMTATIQNALDNTTGGAVLLKAGTYNVEGELYFRHSNVVLRGEGDNTVIYAKGKSNLDSSGVERELIRVGDNVSRTYTSRSAIIENVPVGQLWIRVAEPLLYNVADDVVIYRPATAEWISDLRMDQIPQNAENKVKQWTPSAYGLYSDRKVVRISADTVFLDNPVVMSLSDVYGEENRGFLYHVSCERVRECGVENLKLVSEYNAGELDAAGNHIDEDHCWSAIQIRAAEHCWVRNVSTEYFAYCAVHLIDGARYITVSDCISRHPVSVLTGSRRYAFHISSGELSVVMNCRAEEDRHGFVTGPKVSGPNVFLSCEMVNAFSDVGPHQRWAMGALYDNQITDGLLAVQDGCNNGSGHGWRGTNFILWNCTAAKIVCQSPWATGLNWCVGCVGTKDAGRRKDRLDGEWISHGTPVSPASLYEYQLSQRREKGIRLTQMLF